MKPSGKTGNHSNHEPKAQSAKPHLTLLADCRSSSPRASLAFSALAAADWFSEKFGRRFQRIALIRRNDDARSEAPSQACTAKCTTQGCAVLLLALSCVTVRAQQASSSSASGISVPRLVSFSGKLTDVQGKPASQIEGVTFAIYKDQQGGAPLWLETQNVMPDSSGRYSVQLGTTKSDGLPLDVFASGEARWLGV
jgi:hypothetical protein